MCAREDVGVMVVMLSEFSTERLGVGREIEREVGERGERERGGERD